MDKLNFKEFQIETKDFLKKQGKRGVVDFYSYMSDDTMYIVNNDSENFCEFEITCDFENKFYYFQNYTISDVKNFLKVIESCLKTEKYIFIETKNLITKGFTKFNSFEIPLSLREIDIETFMRNESNLLFNSLKPKNQNFDMNSLKKLVSLNRDNKFLILFDDNYIYNSDGFILQSICKNTTKHKGVFFESYMNLDWNKSEIKKQELQFSNEAINASFLFEVETKELNLILKQALTCTDKKNSIIFFNNGSFYSKDSNGYQFDYGLNDSKGTFAIKTKAIEFFLKDLKDKEICVYMNQNNMVFLVSNTRNTLTMNFCDDFLKEYYKK